MAVSDVEVANLAASSAETPPPLTEQVKAEESDFYEPPTEAERAKIETPKATEAPKEPKPDEPKEPDTAVIPAPAPAAKVEPVKHSAADIATATQLLIDEIDDMTPKELARAIKSAQRVAQAVWDAAKKDTPKTEAKADEKPATPEYDLDKNEIGYTDELIQTMRDAREARVAKEEVKALKEQLQIIQADRVHDRLDRQVSTFGDEATKALDRSTAAGQAKFHELLVKMNFVQQEAKAFGKDLPEKEIMQEALYRMRIATAAAAKADKGAAQDSAVEEALKKRQEEFNEGALGKVEGRKRAKGVHEIIRDKLQKIGLPVAERGEPNTEVEWPD